MVFVVKPSVQIYPVFSTMNQIAKRFSEMLFTENQITLTLLP